MIILLIILPFLPGPPNKVVIGFSVFAQSAGFFGLLLLPIGITWSILELIKWGKINNEIPDWRPAYIIAIIATVIITAIALLLIIGTFANSEPIARISALILAAYGLVRAFRAIKKLRNNSEKKLNPIPFYLLTIPLIAFFTRIHVMGPVSDHSRNVVIKRSRALIAAIEEYKIKEGQYPDSIHYLNARYKMKIPGPFIMGILNFRYNKINDHYSISFSQWLDLGSLEEIVLYDKNNLKNNLKGEYARYDYKFDLCRVKGAFASHDTRYDHWRYYLVD